MFSLSKRELQRLDVLTRLDNGLLIAKEAAAILNLSVRQVRRILAAYRKGGAATLAHGNRGRQPSHTIPPQVRQQVIELVQSKYRDYNHQHLSEVLGQQERVDLSRPALRRILLSAGLRSPRKRRAPKHRQRRERYAQEGMLIQIDGSPHDWLEGRGPWLSLIAGVDDATGKIAGGVFRLQEDAQGYFLLLEQIAQRHGLPVAVYHDQHGIFERLPKQESLEEQLAGQSQPTQFGRLLEELGIGSVKAHSPQAKGRVERLFETLQDRLVKALRQAEAQSVEEANRVLEEFVPAYNVQFGVESAQSGVAYRPWPQGQRLQEVFCFKYERVVGADNTVRFAGERLQILPSRERASYARLRIEVHERMDGSLGLYHEGRCLATREAPAEAPVLRARATKRASGKRVSSSATPSLPTAGATGVPAKSEGACSNGDGRSLDQAEQARESRQRPRVPGPDHPWRTMSPQLRQQLAKQATVTKSLNS